MSRIINAVEHAELERRKSTILPPASRGVQEMTLPLVSESWKEATALVVKQLQDCEQQLAGQAASQAKHQERLAQMEEEKKQVMALQQAASEKIALLEKSRLAWTRQLEALKECARLSQAYGDMEQSIEASRQRIKNTEETQKQMADKLVIYRQEQANLQAQAEQIRFRLASVLAATGTTDQRIS